MAGQKTRQQTANDRRQEPPEEGPNNYDHITFYAFHSFLVEIQTKLETYVPFMSNTNLEIYKAARLKILLISWDKFRLQFRSSFFLTQSSY